MEELRKQEEKETTKLDNILLQRIEEENGGKPRPNPRQALVVYIHPFNLLHPQSYCHALMAKISKQSVFIGKTEECRIAGKCLRVSC